MSHNGTTSRVVLLNKHYARDQMKENGMGVACDTYEGEEKCTPTLMEKPKGKRPLGRPTRRRKVTLNYMLNK